MTNNRYPLHWFAVSALVLVPFLGLGWFMLHKMSLSKYTPNVQADEPDSPPKVLSYKVVKPAPGVLERLSTQPCTVEMFASVRLFAKVPGFLKVQNVDIGSEVKSGDVLAEVDVPELEKQKQHNAALVDLAKSRVAQMCARLDSAKADLEASKAEKEQAAATAKSSAAWVRFRGKQFKRFEELFSTHSIEEKVLDESKERHEAAKETELASIAAIKTTDAKISAALAKIEQVKADVSEAESNVKVTQADLEKSEVLLKFAVIKAPFDGVITNRNFYPGDFIRAAGEGGNNEPLLTLDRNDKMRVIVSIPDRDAPFTDVNDSAEVELDCFPGIKLMGKVSLISRTLDPQTRLMRVEVHLPNPAGKIYRNVYGRVTIILDKQRDLYSIPASCLLSSGDQGKTASPSGNLRWDIPTNKAPLRVHNQGAVYVVRNGHAQRIAVTLGTSDGLRVVVLSGSELKSDDQVILHPDGSLEDGVEVSPILWNETTEKKAGAR